MLVFLLCYSVVQISESVPLPLPKSDDAINCGLRVQGLKENGSIEDRGPTHSVEKRFKCEMCDKGFPNNSSLVAHVRSHTGGKPYRCDYCAKHTLVEVT